jgi:hypothetical protein
MLRIRPFTIGGLATAAVLLVTALPAGASAATAATSAAAATGTAGGNSTAGPAGSRPLPAQPAAGRDRIGPASAFIDNELGADSCNALSNGSSAHFTCEAAGWWADINGDAVDITPLILGWDQGSSWGGFLTGGGTTRYPNIFQTAESCASPRELEPTCLIVGEHYKTTRHAAQFAEYGAGGVSPVLQGNPKGDTWSSLQGVSCPVTTLTFCMVVGQAGTSKKSGSKVVYHGKATVYTFNGSKFRRLTVPSVARARDSELASVSCFSTTACVAVGNYTGAAGKWRGYAAIWTAGKWKLQTMPGVSHQSRVTMESVSCPAAATCVATAVSQDPGEHAAAQRWTGGKWRNMTMPSRGAATLYSISCPTTTSCFAVGGHGNGTLAETWNGTRWSVQKSPVTGKPDNGDNLNSVSCVAVKECVAVGFRFNPKTRPSRQLFRNLAEEWNGTTWRVQTTPNQ